MAVKCYMCYNSLYMNERNLPNHEQSIQSGHEAIAEMDTEDLKELHQIISRELETRSTTCVDEVGNASPTESSPESLYLGTRYNVPGETATIVQIAGPKAVYINMKLED